MKRHIEVVAAILHEKGKVFATQRGYGEFKGYWEFPGGKIEVGETAEEALHREINEELEADVDIERLFRTIEWEYPSFHLRLHCYLCRPVGKTMTLKEHSAARWLDAEELESVEWLPADVNIIEELKDVIKKS